MSQSKIEKTIQPEILPSTELVLEKTRLETILAIRPTAVLLQDTLKVLGSVVDSARLSDILFVAQECGVIEGKPQRGEIYNFSPFGPEGLRPVSGELEYDLVLLDRYQVINRSDNGEVSWRLGKEGLSEEELDLTPLGVIKKPTLLKKVAQIAPDQLRKMAKLLIIRKAAENDEEFFEMASKSLYFIGEDEKLKLMIKLAEIVTQARQESV